MVNSLRSYYGILSNLTVKRVFLEWHEYACYFVNQMYNILNRVFTMTSRNSHSFFFFVLLSPKMADRSNGTEEEKKGNNTSNRSF